MCVRLSGIALGVFMHGGSQRPPNNVRDTRWTLLGEHASWFQFIASMTLLWIWQLIYFAPQARFNLHAPTKRRQTQTALQSMSVSPVDPVYGHRTSALIRQQRTSNLLQAMPSAQSSFMLFWTTSCSSLQLCQHYRNSYHHKMVRNFKFQI